ncbi:MAG: translational GTPase TypA [Chlamydiae bacterium]|nr:translational GTPase TypA [Chlamydiota bacterium]MBI3266380.1 translational GTPase TypA [Chlamydiota bacterium]
MSAEKRRPEIRNIAIIAHVDHGKTTLVDALLRQSGEFKPTEEITERLMDTNELERERGITIFSKIASVEYKGVRINIVDTPGHADFGSEVERILKMVDGVLLLVDAFEGPMPQTKFVLKKSLELHLKPVVIINKVDRPNARPHEVLDQTFDLFCDLNASDEQLDFAVVYASGREGKAWIDLKDESQDLKPLFETLIHRVLPPIANPEKPLQMLITMLDYDDYLGVLGMGRIYHGKMKIASPVTLIKSDGTQIKGKITGLFTYRGMQRIPVQEVSAGDIVCIAGLEKLNVGETVADSENPEALPLIKIDEPTISMTFAHNSSPLAGKDGGKFLTSRHVRERLIQEARTNIGIHVEETQEGEALKVSGRGELQLAILIETMRREGYELEVSRPEVILKEMGKEILEPVENLVIEIEEQYQGVVLQALGPRKATMTHMEKTSSGNLRMEFTIPSRGLLGFRGECMTLTRGTIIMYHVFLEYQPYKGGIERRQTGVLISQGFGKTVAFALNNLQERGMLFVGPGADLYEGMIVGENNKGNDLVVNAIKEKKLTNMRASGSDEAIRLTPHREWTLELALEYIEDDERVEVTPKSIRLRKRVLNEIERKSASRSHKALEDRNS